VVRRMIKFVLKIFNLKSKQRTSGANTKQCGMSFGLSEFQPSTMKQTSNMRVHEPQIHIVLSPPCEACVSLKGKLFNATNENIELQQEVTYLTARLEKTILSKKIIEEDLSRVEESATKSTYRLGVGFERCEDKGKKSAPKFIPSSTYHKEEATIKPTKAHHPSNPKPSFNPKREARKETPKPREEVFVCMFRGRPSHLDEFCFQCKRIEKRHFEYARNSYHDEFFDLPPRSYSRVLPRSYSRASPHTFSGASSRFSHGPNH
jgi:hypothetical protein